MSKDQELKRCKECGTFAKLDENGHCAVCASKETFK